jgi:hypothetical protein
VALRVFIIAQKRLEPPMAAPIAPSASWQSRLLFALYRINDNKAVSYLHFR